jgi:hypothetical protein
MPAILRGRRGVWIGRCPDRPHGFLLIPRGSSGATLGSMTTTYAVSWQEEDGRVFSGKLEVRPTGLRLNGANGGAPKVKVVPLKGLAGLRMGRTEERLGGRPTLVLQFPRGSIKIASVVQPGIVSELAERIAALTLDRRPTGLAVVVPINPARHDAVRTLLRRGAPFDPAKLGIERHRVFLTRTEVVFDFEMADAEALEQLAGDATVLAAATEWRELVDGPPRLAELVYSWKQPHDSGLVFEPTPGPGDSDGGDLFPP